MTAHPPNDPFFVVGAARSGTTLLRVILDSHRRLVVPRESRFIVGGGWGRLRRRHRPRTLEELLAHPDLRKWWLIDDDAVRRKFSRHSDPTYRDLVSAPFEAYAEVMEKPRWGDKTPDYVHHLRELLELFPGARVIHVIRDGRDVAASLAERPFGPPSPVVGAFRWRRYVRAGLRAGRWLGPERYLEVRLEDLIREPERVARGICAFLGEEYDPGMLDYPSRFPAEHFGPNDPHKNLALPPTPGLRDWRAGVSEREARAVEAVCHDLLERLGYEVPGPPSPAALASAYLLRAAHLPRGAVKAWRHRRQRRPPLPRGVRRPRFRRS